ncbi:flagellar export chaperone FliS [Macromonas nakdongensis]|uniref:flagellar export chaperone FliS n=1 Tax=Macromonas nakdongensis TaxID=1843082 RepID=UPI000C3462F0|nr:flagellar export chaperone FliS [Macromonas nakdongensis]
MTFPSNRAASAYRNVGLQTRAPQHDQHQLVTMMFESVLESLARARGAIEQGDTATKVQQVAKAIRIVQEGLRTSLDLENGGELAGNLANLYDYAVMRMTQANAMNDTRALEEVAQLIKPVAEAWQQMRAGTPDATPTANASEPSTPTRATPSKAPPTVRRLGNVYGPGMAYA